MELEPLRGKSIYGDKGMWMVVDGKRVGKIYYELHGKSLTIGYIKVGSGHRKKGYAKAGLQALLDHFPQVDKITTTTIRRTNKASVSLFKSLGFEFYVTKGNQWICKLTKPSLKSRRRPKKSNKDEDLVALLRRFEEVHFQVLLDHTDHLPNRQKWAKSSIEPALEAYGDMAEDLATSPSSLKATEDRRAFHYFAMKYSLASMAKKGIIRRNLDVMNDLASLAYDYHLLPVKKQTKKKRQALAKKAQGIIGQIK